MKEREGMTVLQGPKPSTGRPSHHDPRGLAEAIADQSFREAESRGHNLLQREDIEAAVLVVLGPVPGGFPRRGAASAEAINDWISRRLATVAFGLVAIVVSVVVLAVSLLRGAYAEGGFANPWISGSILAIVASCCFTLLARTVDRSSAGPRQP